MKSVKILMAVAFLLTCFAKGLYAQKIKDSIQPLSNKQQCIVTIAAFTANGNMPKLHTALNNGLNTGLTINEIKEILIQLYAYAGFPRSLNGITALETVVNERKQKGIQDVAGKTPSAVKFKHSKFDFGRNVQTKLTGSTATGTPQKFVPVIDTFLKEHLFADVFSRDILDYQTREIVTIAALASLGGADNQLRSHINVGRYNGFTASQLNNIADVIKTNIGEAESDAMKRILQPGEKENANLSTLPKAETIFPTGEKITNNNFVGDAWLQQMITNDSLNATQVGNVTFSPGARTNWHLHKGGQILLITAGKGYYQEQGSQKRIINKGDVVKCPPNILHWHGASKHEALTHISITSVDKGAAVWLQPVSDEEYSNDL